MAAPLSARCKVLADVEPPVLPGGAAPYGNFPNYSCFHPPEGRVCLLPATLLSELFPSPRVGPLLGLDVGCNSGVRKRKEREGKFQHLCIHCIASPLVSSRLQTGIQLLRTQSIISILLRSLLISVSISRSPANPTAKRILQIRAIYSGRNCKAFFVVRLSHPGMFQKCWIGSSIPQQ